ncbi:Acetoin utilization deacetylase AcuC [Desulfoluna spongiiphila]|uniref:Acetoin utilization deacetylase AcuC n=2 Tax=Desulfoluna spongiiphila TaxID=419481 RepID=A0A1G5AD62_9BACT|nr:histone deacetylase [Desulfoluna spongiiphila]SCX75777.1 Acetoin utilization deacetylase AcuC [Desulfoluna spongiiphila]
MIKADRKTGLVFFPAFDWAIDPTHPEREERLLYTQDQVFEEGLFDIEGITEFKPDLVTHEDIRRVHFCTPDIESVTTESHLISAGGAVTVAKAVMEGAVEKGFALVRPPGHHAMRVVHGNRGFCNINIEAIMIEYIRAKYGVRRVAVVDTDCHHGDGTQDIFWHDPDTLFISIHQDGRTLYPGSGFIEELGGPNALGTTVNIPLPPLTSDEGYLWTIENVVMPILEDFQPEIIVNSAGQDNHFSDPLTNMNFSARGYADLTDMLSPDIAVLEGGYSIEGALPYVNTGIILALAGLDYTGIKEPGFDVARLVQPQDVTRQVRQIGQAVLSTWRQREALQAKLVGNHKTVSRRRNIMYDTDMIYEMQIDEITVCNSCKGALKVDSSSDTGHHLFGVHIPKGVCPACRARAEQWFEESKNGPYTLRTMQDLDRQSFFDEPREA